MKTFTKSILAAASALLLTLNAQAITFNFSTIHTSSGTPAGPAPYAVLDVTQNGANNVKLSLLAGNLGSTEFVSIFKYNILGSATSPTITPSVLTSVGGAPTFSFSASPATDAGLSFDAEVGFPSANSPAGNRFTDNERFEFNLLRTGLTVADITLDMMIHIQGINPDGSAKVIATLAPDFPSTGVPDSGSTIALLGLAVAALAFAKRKF